MMLDELTRSKINTIKSHSDPLTQAQLVTELLRDSRIRNVDLARELGIKPSYLSHLIRVMKLPEAVTDGYWNKQLSFTHLILISRLKKQEDIMSLYEEILRHSLNVQAVERRIREILYLVDTKGKYVPKERLDMMKSRISASLGEQSSVAIVQTRIKAKITIEVQGNLDKTSNFLEQFASRFRHPRKSRLPPDRTTNTAEDAVNSSIISQRQEGVTADEGGTVVDEPLPDKRYRFDPDY